MAAEAGPLPNDEYGDDVEMKRLSLSSNSTHSDDSQLLFNDEELMPKLPPQDRGWGAWSFLVGVWLVEAMLWGQSIRTCPWDLCSLLVGFFLSFGVFQSYYSSNPLFKDDKLIPVIGAVGISISYLGLPLTNALVLRFPRYQRHMVCAGWALSLGSLVLASFATKVWHLLLTQGFMFGISWVICYTPFLVAVNDWFNLRRGLAYGILFSASGVSGLILPFALEMSMHRFGFRNTLRGYVLLCILISGPGLFMIKPRSYPPAVQEAKEPKNRPSTGQYAFLRNPYAYAFALAVLFQGVVFFIPPTFLPSFATSLGMSHAQGDSLLAINSAFQVIGQLLLGHYSDRTHPHIPIAMSTVMSGLGALLLWGPAKTFLPLAAAAAVWGFFAQSFSVLWYRGIQHVTKNGNELWTMYGLISAERGISMFLQGPISSWLLGDEVEKDVYGIGKYRAVIIITGSLLLLATFCELTFFFEKRPDESAEDI